LRANVTEGSSMHGYRAAWLNIVAFRLRARAYATATSDEWATPGERPALLGRAVRRQAKATAQIAAATT
jgi:hypothetical protein